MRRLPWAILVLSCIGVFPTAAAAVHLSPEGERGEGVFLKNCASCHTIGGGRTAGPDLAGVTRKRDRAWLVRIITNPGELLDSGDPVARKLLEEFRGLRMPDLGISPRDADAILEYLAAVDAAPPEAAAPAAPPPAGGDPETGRALFAGAVRLRNGGAPCAACHAVAGLPGGGATLGPDLTATYGLYGEDGIAAMLADLPFPSMSPIYGTRPLTVEEQAHLAAFLRAASDREPPAAAAGFLLVGLGGGALAAVLAQAVWRKRLREVRRPLLRRASSGGGGDR